ncbi:SRPBCC family protein [Janthinobacterium psychrotolerans]|uniref:Polyketide cyclase / dehydrase and lipid transport n=1 Tax=Janthinobacterium psychrotolerans TaxID=1747903 RepID=A0A1A7BUP1_9BURK|nr:SRPBCC family protein [Janthinobacterium psychrotolerans]OBV37222.1 Polyketide cyclase / dehydrase and lipid transport [Janthinobacterium psychrotolerans]
MKTLLFVLAACGPLAAFTATAAAAVSVNLVDVSKPGVPGKAFAASTSMPASVAAVCAAIQDFAGYPQFMPNVDKIKVAPAGGGASLVDVTLKLPMGKVKQYRLKMTPKTGDASCNLAWKLVPMEGVKIEDTIFDTSGYWQLSPDPQDAGATAIKYQVYTDPGPVPMGFGWIVDSMSRDSIPKMFDALRARVAAKK